MIRHLLLLILTAFSWAACQQPGGGTNIIPDPNTKPGGGGQPEKKTETIQVSFTESTEYLLNPERGFYGGATDIFSASNPISASKARSVREKGMTLMYVGFYLNKFLNGDISQDYLNMIQKSFDAIRGAGIKCVLRFAYQNSEGNTPWDAPVDIVLRHVEQLKPVLEANEDVIFVLQAGFVGVWGEWYYTTNFIMEPSSDADYQPRRRLTDALLEALPESRQIALRTPQFKMRMYNLSLKDTLSAETAHNGSPLSRLAGHNDCFGASQNDWGTFDNETSDRNFWKRDSRYTIMGGETCNVSSYCVCNSSLKDMKDYHWTYLNSGYHSGVLDRWKSSGCMDEVTNRLGYRLIMREASCTGIFEKGNTVHLVLNLENGGFAAPMNPRNAELVFVAQDGKQTRFPLVSDPRTWHPGTHKIETDCVLPDAKGTFYLALEDPLLAQRPEYSIALANENVFDTQTGWNKLIDIQ